MLPTIRHSSVRPSNGDAAPGTGVTRRRLTGSGRLPGAVDLLPLEEVERHASVLSLPALGADRLDHVRVGKRRRIAKSALFGDVAQQAAHDLARAGLGQVGGKEEELRLRDRPDDLGDVTAQLFPSALLGSCSAAKDDVGEDRLARDRVVLADDRRFGDGLVIDQRATRPRSSRSGGPIRSSHRRPGPGARSSPRRRAWHRRLRSTSPGSGSSRSPCTARGRRRCREASPAMVA